MASPTVIVIGGPTASGKTCLAARVALELGTDVIGADARQFYRELPIGTAQPTEEERLGVKHHFIGHLDIHEDMSAAAYAEAALPVLHDLLARHGVAVVSGGSGLYIDALLFELDPLPPADAALRERLQALHRDHGVEALAEELDRLDPEAGAAIDRRNPHRLVRAIELVTLTGKPLSALRTGKRPREGFTVRWIALDLPREELYARIDTRVDAMMAAGLVAEARAVFPHRGLNSLRTVGYSELFEHFEGRCTRDEAVARIKQHTRNYAKRQLTWLRRDAHWRWVDPRRPEEVLRAAAGS